MFLKRRWPIIVGQRHQLTAILVRAALCQKPVATRTTRTLRKAEKSLPVDCSQQLQETKPLPNVDHSYALPADPTGLKARLSEALARVESLERDMRHVKKHGACSSRGPEWKEPHK